MRGTSSRGRSWSASPTSTWRCSCEARRPEWEWFEIVLAYDNARLPEALLRAGKLLGRQDLIDCGVATLDWIVAKQTAPGGFFRAVGSESFGRPYAEPLPFDQQPLEAQGMVEACRAAFDATGDTRWIGRGRARLSAGSWAPTISICRWRAPATAAVSTG